MGSIYRSGGGSGGGSIYRSGGGGGGTIPVGTAAAGGGKSKGGGGIVATLKHVVTQTPKDFYHAAVNAPAGFAQELYREVKHLPDVIAHPGDSVNLTAGDAANVVKATVATLRHPLRNPGDTILTALPFGEGLARVAEAGSAIRAGATAGDVAKAVVNRGEHTGQTFKVGDLKVTAPASRSALGRAGQAAHAKVIRSSDTLNTRRVAKELGKNQDVVNAAERGHAAALIASGKKRTAAEQTALRTVGEGSDRAHPTVRGVKTDERIAYHEGRARGVGKAERARHEAKIALLQESKQFLDETGPQPRFSDAHRELHKLYERTVKSAKDREQLLEMVGKMTPEAAQGRIHAPGRLIVHGEENLVTAPSGQVSVRVPTAPGHTVYALERDVSQSETVLRGERGRLSTLERRLAKPPKPVRLPTREEFIANRPKPARGDEPPTVEKAVRSLKEQKGKPGVTIENAYYHGLQAGSPYEKLVVMRNDAGDPVGVLTVHMRIPKGAENLPLGAAAPESRIPELLSIAVKPEYRRQGIATALYKAAEDAGIPVRRASGKGGYTEEGAALAYSRLARQAKTPAARARPKLAAKVAKQRESVSEWQKIADQAHEALTTKGPRLEPAVSAGEIRVPYPRPGDLRSSLKAARPAQIRAAKGVSYPQAPGSLTHQFTGANLKTANFADETTRAVGESNLEAQKYATLLRLRDELKKAAKPVPTSETHDIPMRLDNLKSGTLQPAERALLDKIEHGGHLTTDERASAGGLFEKVRGGLFMKKPVDMTPEEHAGYLKLAEEGKIAWVDRRLLRGLDKQAPKLEAILGSKATKGIDAVNNAARVGIFYGKPGYILPNVLGNVALNLIHQGFLAVPNIARALRLDADVAARVDEVMGEGISRTLSAHEGIGSRGINFVAGKYSKVTDRPFRRAAFLYEARRSGYTDAAGIKRLFADHARGDLVTVTRRAKTEILDFDSSLTPRERELVRRVVFVYPFLKASTKYAGTLVREHPVKTGVLGQLGAAGYEQNQKDLAPFPSYFEGAFKVGGSQERPLVVNPSGINILQPPAQIAAALAALVTGHTNKVSAPSNFTSPAASFIGDMLGGKGARKAGVNLATGLPQYLLGQRLAEAAHGGGTTRLYPPTTATAIGQFLAGSISPRYSSTAGRAKAAAREKSGR